MMDRKNVESIKTQPCGAEMLQRTKFEIFEIRRRRQQRRPPEAPAVSGELSLHSTKDADNSRSTTWNIGCL